MSTGHKICVTCGSKKTTKHTAGVERAEWLRKVNYVQEFILKQNIRKKKNNYRPKSQNTFTINVGRAYRNRYLLFWATTKAPTNSVYIKGAKEAYAAPKFPNSGVAKVQANGHAAVSLVCPRIYRAKEAGQSGPKKSYMRHMHYVLSDKQNKKWLSKKVMTRPLYCDVGLEAVQQSIKSGSAVVLNTLPCNVYGVDHIPGTWNVPYTYSETQSTEQIQTIVHRHFPNFREAIRGRQLRLHEVPIITYCAHSKCDASHRAMEVFKKAGFVNMSWFPGGMKAAGRPL